MTTNEKMKMIKLCPKIKPFDHKELSNKWCWKGIQPTHNTHYKSKAVMSRTRSQHIVWQDMGTVGYYIVWPPLRHVSFSSMNQFNLHLDLLTDKNRN